MGDFEISVVNNTCTPDIAGRSVKVMLFQTQPNPLETDSYSTAWKVEEVQSPGEIGPITLPEKVQFAVLDKTPEGDKRKTGPIDVKFGQIIDVVQATSADAPKISISGESQPKKEIKVSNQDGNAKPLEMALFKNGRKLVSFKDVIPGDSVYLDVEPVIYIANVSRIVQGEDFKAADQASRATKFEFQKGVPSITIQITQLENKQLKFSLF